MTLKRSGIKRNVGLQPGGPLKPGKALKRTAAPQRRQPMARTTSTTRAPRTERQTAEDAAKRAFSRAVKARAAGRCEACPRLARATTADGLTDAEVAAARARARDCPGQGRQAHHIRGRGAGGHGDHSPDNGIWLCGVHDWLHHHGVGARVAFALGLRARRRV